MRFEKLGNNFFKKNSFFNSWRKRK